MKNNHKSTGVIAMIVIAVMLAIVSPTFVQAKNNNGNNNQNNVAQQQKQSAGKNIQAKNQAKSQAKAGLQAKKKALTKGQAGNKSAQKISGKKSQKTGNKAQSKVKKSAKKQQLKNGKHAKQQLKTTSTNNSAELSPHNQTVGPTNNTHQEPAAPIVGGVDQESPTTGSNGQNPATDIEQQPIWKTILFGTGYKNLGQLRSSLVHTDRQIQQLTAQLSQTQDQAQKVALQQQINKLNQERSHMLKIITDHKTQFSLIGWALRLINGQPIDPVDPADPTDPAEPTNPTTPTAPTTSTNPTDPANPTTPTILTSPANPTDPAHPTEQATDTTDPANPADTGAALNAIKDFVYPFDGKAFGV